MTNDVSKQIVNWDDSKYLEQRIAELEFRNKELTDELTALKAELVGKKQSVWLPEDGQEFYYLTDTGFPRTATFKKTLNDDCLMINNNVFKCNKSTFNHLTWYNDNVLKVQNRLMQLHEMLCPDYLPDWSNKSEGKYTLFYDTARYEWSYHEYNYINISTVTFTKEAAEKACEILNTEKFMIGDDA